MIDTRELIFWESLLDGPLELFRPVDRKAIRMNQEILRRHFLSHGLTERSVEIPELGITVELEPYEFYLFKPVKSPKQSAKTIYQLIGEKFKYGNIKDDNTLGFFQCFTYEEDGAKSSFNIVLSRSNLAGIESIANSAHENGHFLEENERQNLIYSKYNVPVKYQKQLNEEEDFANFCEFTAIHRVGGNLSKAKFYPGNINDLGPYEARQNVSLKKVLKIAKECFSEKK